MALPAVSTWAGAISIGPYSVVQGRRLDAEGQARPTNDIAIKIGLGASGEFSRDDFDGCPMLLNKRERFVLAVTHERDPTVFRDDISYSVYLPDVAASAREIDDARESDFGRDTGKKNDRLATCDCGGYASCE